MRRRPGQTQLSREISDILRRTSDTTGLNPRSRSVVYGSLAMLALAPAPANAVALGEIKLLSALGEPLRATVPMQVGSGENLGAGCVTATRGQFSTSGPRDLRVNTPAVSRPGSYDLRVTSFAALREPIYELALQVNCPGLPLLVREYVLMLDLPGMQLPAVPAGVTQPVNSSPARASTFSSSEGANSRREAVRPSANGIPAGGIYRVRSGDTLSTIAKRVEGRPPDTIWKVANIIFQMNPNAFIRQNPDGIKMGVQIRIPDAADWAGPVTALTPTPVGTLEAPAAARAPVQAEPVARAPAPAVRQEEFDTRAEVSSSESSAALDNGQRNRSAVPAQIAEAVEALDAISAMERASSLDSPFADERAPAPADNDIAVADEFDPLDTDALLPVAEDAPAVSVETSAEPATREVSAFTAISVGILIGLALSLVMLRTRLMEALSGLFARKGSRSARTSEQRFENTDEMFATDSVLPDYGKRKDDSFVVSESDSTSDATAVAAMLQASQSQKQPAQSPAEPEASQEIEAPAAREEASDTVTSAVLDDSHVVDFEVDDDYAKSHVDIDVSEAYAPPEGDVSTALSPKDSSLDALFNSPDDDNLTAEVPFNVAEIFSETGVIHADDIADVMEPTSSNEEIDAADVPLDDTAETVLAPQSDQPTTEMPTAEMPMDIDQTEDMPGADKLMLEPTAEMPANKWDDETALTKAIDELPELAGLSPENSTQTREAAATDSPTDEFNIEQLAAAADDDDKMSATLQQALALLEKDYEDELETSLRGREKGNQNDDEDTANLEKAEK